MSLARLTTSLSASNGMMTAPALKVRLLLGYEHRLVTDHREYKPALLEDRDKLQAERG